MSKREDLELKGRAAAERQRKGPEEHGEHGNWCESEEEGQLSIYHSDRNLREPQVLSRAGQSSAERMSYFLSLFQGGSPATSSDS